MLYFLSIHKLQYYFATPSIRLFQVSHKSNQISMNLDDGNPKEVHKTMIDPAKSITFQLKFLRHGVSEAFVIFIWWLNN